eukprot:TRINITY_DN23764_c0_g1_i2.p1 TRINITY_DN23764_c0_g1~~TRINITY_DN23764_c0_g1_i2.p1  ORF type:complete len:1274 (+),score=242.93 TRINITY_DN23764_c0_g1_i2:172-3822(+)
MSGTVGGLEVGVHVWVPDSKVVWRAGVVTAINDALKTVSANSSPARKPRKSFGSPRPFASPRSEQGTGVVEQPSPPVGPLITVEVKNEKNLTEFVEVQQQEVHLRNEALKTRSGALAFHDLALLPLLHEPALLHALNVRFEGDVVYTRTGPVLLAVNPFKQVPGLYAPERLRAFAALGADEEAPEPHIFDVARQTFLGVERRGSQHTVLISGESGAGKTETTKFVMRFLAIIGAGGSEDDMSSVERKVLGSIPLMEALGNAKTLRNDNSSRFGKYIDLQFGRHGIATGKRPRLVGAHTHTYLLEKVRVTWQQAGERSFHVFYQLLAAGAAAGGNANSKTDTRGSSVHVGGVELRGVSGYGPQDFAYLRNSGCYTIVGAVDEGKMLDATLASFACVGIPAGVAAEIFGALMAILHLGNVAFKAPKNNSEGSEPVSGSPGDVDPLAVSSGLLGVEVEDLAVSFCRKTVKTPHDGRIISSAQTIQKADDTRDALARHLYGAIFAYVVKQANAAVSADHGCGNVDDKRPFVGVLDIFGFEFFQVNSLEQLFINYTNELLQKHFNEVIFEHEEELYARECITWNPLDFPDNTAIVDLIGQAPMGILPFLDEECMTVGGSSVAWCSKLQRAHASSPHFKVVLTRQDHFVVRHFAGPVEYASPSFMEKNRDQLGADIVGCLKQSSNAFIRERFLEHDRTFGTQETVASSGARRMSRARMYTVAAEFRGQLQDLMQRIRTTEPHFVRCIKPNPQSVPDVLDRASVAEQLRYQGVMQAIEVSRAGFPLRLRHRQGTIAYRCIAPPWLREQVDVQFARGKFDQAARSLFSGLCERPILATNASGKARGAGASANWGGLPGLDASFWSVGATLLFFKQAAVQVLGAALASRRRAAATHVETWWRGFTARRRFLCILNASRQVQAATRGWSARRRLEVQRQHTAASRLQTSWHCRLARRELRERRRALAVLQAWGRHRSCRCRFLRTIKGTMLLQRWWKRKAFRLLALRRKRAAVQITRSWRGYIVRRGVDEVVAARHRRWRAGRRLLRRWQQRVCDRLLMVPTSDLEYSDGPHIREGVGGRATPLCNPPRTFAATKGLRSGQRGDDASFAATVTRCCVERSPSRPTNSRHMGGSPVLLEDHKSRNQRMASPELAMIRLEGASIGELLAAAAALKARCVAQDAEVAKLRSVKEALQKEARDLEQWTVSGIFSRFASSFFVDSCGPRGD